MNDSDADEGQSSDDEELDDGNADARSAISSHDDEQATQLIDDNGNLFGVVNIIDALVVLLTLAVVVAGVTLVFGGGSNANAPAAGTSYATLDLGTHQSNLLSEINEGDSSGDLTVTDVYIVPEGDQQRAFARVRLNGSVPDETLIYNDAPLRIGRSLQITTDQYDIKGVIRDVGNASTLNIVQTDLVVEQTIAPETAEQLTDGDEFRINDRVIGTIESVNTYTQVDSTQVRAVVGLSAATLTDGDTARYGLTPVVRGSEIRLPAAGYQLNGRIIAIGRTEPPGTAATRTVTLRLSEVRDEIADTYQPGMAEVAGGQTTAEITAVDVEPSTVITTSQTGEIKAQDHPINRTVTMTAELSVRELSSGVRFKGKRLQEGSRITLDLGSTTIRPTVVRIR